jgi:homoserine kinase
VANLGPGFDCFALAVSLFNEVTVDTEGEPSVRVEGEGAGELPEDESNLVVRSMAYLFSKGPNELPPLAVTCVNRIPLERGLGSSASAVIAGLLLADRMQGMDLIRSHPDWVLKWAVDLEGHADNAAAALRGGIVLAYRGVESWKIESLVPHQSLRPVVFIPQDERVATTEARRSLPSQVPLESLVFNTSRAALLVLALTSRPDLLAEALLDNVHQEHRLTLAPSSHRFFSRLIEKGIPACVAGSGPSLLAFETEETEIPEPGPGWQVTRVDIAGGAAITES